MTFEISGIASSDELEPAVAVAGQASEGPAAAGRNL